MQELDDIALLREYVERNSEEAFAALIARHVNMVYSVALRHTRNPHQAEEITQAVFVILAQKSRHLGQRVILSGWFYQTARLTSITFIRSEIRRTRREQEAHMQTIANENEPDAWGQIAPLLDTAMTELNETDRHAVVLRYFDGKSMRDVGGALGTTEDAAKKRVNRAVEKLQKFFLKRGIDSTAEAITGAISANAVQAAPVALTKSVMAVALAKGAAASGSTLTLIKGTLKTMTWIKIKMAALASVGVLLAAVGVTTIYETQKDARASSAASAPAEGAAEMRIHWIIGKKYSMRVEFEQDTEVPVPGQPQAIKSEVNFTLNYDVSALKALDNGGRELELEFVNETLNVLQGGVNIMSIDAAQISEPTQNPARAMIGARLHYFTGADGKVERIEGMDELMQRIAATGKSQEQAVFKSIFTEETLRKYVSFDDSMPNRTVAIGQSWERKKDVAGADFGHLTANVKSTFKNWEQHDDRKCAHIEVAGDFSTKTPSAASGALINISKGKFSGDVWFDPELGMIVDAGNEQTMTAEITTQARTITPRVTQRVRMMLLDVQ
jgi:RNA polymerase sigma factor (sigma-70 family)